jgi:putative peptidoglycan lipid II flippase
MQDTRTPMIIAGVIIGLNIAVDFIYFYTFGSDVMKVSGLALGNTTAYLVGTVIVWIVLTKRLGGLDGRRVAGSLAKICVSSAAMGVATWATAYALEKYVGVATFPEQLLQVGAAILVGSLVYIGMAILLKSEEMYALRNLLGRLLRRKQSELEPRGIEPVEEDSIMD